MDSVKNERRDRGGGDDLHAVEVVITGGLEVEERGAVDRSQARQVPSVEHSEDGIVGRAAHHESVGVRRLEHELATHPGGRSTAGRKGKANIRDTVAVPDQISIRAAARVVELEARAIGVIVDAVGRVAIAQDEPGEICRAGANAFGHPLQLEGGAG